MNRVQVSRKWPVLTSSKNRKNKWCCSVPLYQLHLFFFIYSHKISQNKGLEASVSLKGALAFDIPRAGPATHTLYTHCTPQYHVSTVNTTINMPFTGTEMYLNAQFLTAPRFIIGSSNTEQKRIMLPVFQSAETVLF